MHVCVGPAGSSNAYLSKGKVRFLQEAADEKNAKEKPALHSFQKNPERRCSRSYASRAAAKVFSFRLLHNTIY